MSRETLEIVERAVRAATAQPKPDWKTVNELFAPEHVLVPAGAGSGLEDEARGAVGYREWRETVEVDLGGPVHQLEGAVDVGPNTVLTVTTTRFKTPHAGVAGEQRLWNVMTLQHGKIVRTVVYTNPGDALEALGRITS